MHEGQYEVTEDLVHQLLREQSPEFSSLPLRQVNSTGTDNALFRLGPDMLVRMPIIDWAVAAVAKEHEWLPCLAPHVSVEISTPIALGAPGHGYPCRWSIYTWCEGANPIVGSLTKPLELAADLAAFLTSMHGISTIDAPLAERGLPLSERDEQTCACITALESSMQTREILEIWRSGLDLPKWDGPNLWVHGDLSAGNVLLQEGRLCAVIDFGSMGVGDPAADLIIAWNLLPRLARSEFRSRTGVDESTWLRGRALALSIALIQLPYYAQTNLALAENARYVIGEILADYRGR